MNAVLPIGSPPADAVGSPTVVLVGILPTVDLALLRSDDPAHVASAVATIDAACTRIGFFTVVGHGIDPALRRAVLDHARAFFARPGDEKMAISIATSTVHRGYSPVAAEQLQADFAADLKEALDLGPDLGPGHPEVLAGTPLHGPTQWPAQPGFRSAMEAYTDAAVDAARLVLDGLSLALDLPRGFFSSLMTLPMANLRLLHYPPGSRVRPGPGQLGCGAHTDYGSVTLLTDDGVGGLQVRDRDGAWHDVEIPPDALVVNLGDMLARWTNDRYVSTLHRVVNPPDRDRYSVPLFLNPDFHTVVECLPSCTDTAHPPKYEPITAGHYLLSRFDATFDYRRA
jgi:isopenicillin N synthase-like dioxygenase